MAGAGAGETPTHSLDGQHCGQQDGQHGLPGWIQTAGQLL